ncbi:MAG: DMT family transporter [Pseudomonadota bacterium]
MALAVFFSILAGVFGVWQAGMNKVVADSLGFTASLLFNGLFFLAFNSIFFAIVFLKPKAFPSEFTIQWALSDFKWWWVVPGFMGFALVMGLAVSVGRIGAVQTFVISIAAQIFASMAWDMWQGDHSISKLRLAGAVVTLIGAVISTMS